MSKMNRILLFIPIGVYRYLQLPGGGAVLGLTLFFLFLGGLFYPPPAIIALLAGLFAMAWIGNDMTAVKQEKD